jgi:hypothetical protein
MQIKSFFILSLLVTINASAQFNINPDKIIEKLTKPIQSDRPGQALNAQTAGFAAIQIQTGFNYSQNNIGADNNFTNYYIPTSLRFSFTRKWELNTSFFYNHNKWSNIAGETTTSGFLSPEIGLRYAFMKGDGWKPFMALQSNLSFRSRNGDYQQQETGSSFFLVTSNRFDVVSINTNLGVRFQGTGNMDPVVPYVLNFGFNMGSKWTAFIEGFGQFSTSGLDPTINADAGVSYRPIKLLQLDLFGGWLGGI